MIPDDFDWKEYAVELLAFGGFLAAVLMGGSLAVLMQGG